MKPMGIDVADYEECPASRKYFGHEKRRDVSCLECGQMIRLGARHLHFGAKIPLHYRKKGATRANAS